MRIIIPESGTINMYICIINQLIIDLLTNWISDGSGLVGVLGVAGVTTKEYGGGGFRSGKSCLCNLLPSSKSSGKLHFLSLVVNKSLLIKSSSGCRNLGVRIEKGCTFYKPLLPLFPGDGGLGWRVSKKLMC